MSNIGFDLTPRNICLALFVLAIAVFSVLSVIFCIADKRRAKRGARRVPEATLFTVSALGGALCMYITMLLIRHKTKHVKFMVGLPFMILFHALAVYLILT